MRLDLLRPRRWSRVLAVAALLIQNACATSERRNALPVATPAERLVAEAPLTKQREASPPQATISAGYRPHAIASACPAKEMSCYPGCATVNDLYVCGQALLVAAGSLAAAVALVAHEQGLTLADFCLRYEVLCADKATSDADKATAAPKPIALPRNTPCRFTGREKDVGPLPAVYLCLYQCEGVAEEIVVELDPGVRKCPGEERGEATWEKIGGLRRRRP